MLRRVSTCRVTTFTLLFGIRSLTVQPQQEQPSTVRRVVSTTEKAKGSDKEPSPHPSSTTTAHSETIRAMPSYSLAATRDPYRWRRLSVMTRELFPALTLTTGIFTNLLALPIVGLPSEWGVLACYVAGFLGIQRLFLRGFPLQKPRPRLVGHVCLVTGGSNGIGSELSASLLEAGATVMATTHSTPVEEAHTHILNRIKYAEQRSAIEESGRLSVYPLALEDSASIKRFVASVREHFPKGLDLVVANAGCMMEDAVVHTGNRMEQTIDVNFVGTVQLVEALAPLLCLDGKEGRVVVPISHGHRIISTRRGTTPIVDGFFAPKFKPTPRLSELAEQQTTENSMEEGDEYDYANADPNYNRLRQFYSSHFGRACLVRSLAERGIPAVSVCPGRVLTRLRRRMFPEMQRYWSALYLSVMRTTNDAVRGILVPCTCPLSDLVNGGHYVNGRGYQNAVSRWVKPAMPSVMQWATNQRSGLTLYQPDKHKQ